MGRLPMSNLEVVQELYRAFREKDHDAFRLLCTPDLEWIQNEGFPDSATYRGAEAVIHGVFKANDERWDHFSFHIEQYLEAGDSVMVIGAYRGRHRRSQKPLHAVAAHLYQLVDGKVSCFRMFADTKTIWDAML